MERKIFNAKKYIRFERTNLDITGFYAGEFSQKWFTPYVQAIIIFISLFQTEAMIHFMYEKRENLIEISGTCMLCIEYSAFIFKCISLWRNRKSILLLEDILAEDSFSEVSENGLHTINKLLNCLSPKTKFYQMTCVVAIIFIGILPVFENTEHGEKIYPLPCKFPFNSDNYYGYVYFGEMLSLFCGGWLSSTYDNLFVKLMTIGTAHFAILAKKIRNLANENRKLNDQEIRIILKECIVHQQALLRYISVLQNAFSNGVFLQFVCSGMVICLTGFQMLVVNMYNLEFAVVILYFCAMVSQLTLYCWYGQLVMEESDDISSACYDINWHNMSVTNQKMLILIMEGAKKPVIVKAGGFFELNIKCLMAILRTSYSYFAILRQVYNKSTTHL